MRPTERVPAGPVLPVRGLRKSARPCARGAVQEVEQGVSHVCRAPPAVIAGLVTGGFLVSGLSASSQDLAFASAVASSSFPLPRPRPARATGPASPTRRAHRRRRPRPPRATARPLPRPLRRHPRPSSDRHPHPARLSPHLRPPRRARARIPPRLPTPTASPTSSASSSPTPSASSAGSGSATASAETTSSASPKASARTPARAPVYEPEQRHQLAHRPWGAAGLLGAIQAAAMPGPIPNVNVSTTFVGAGNAAGLFPEITPAPTPSPGPEGTNPAAERSVSPAGQALGIVTSAPATSALGLIALVVAFLLVITRLPVRRRKKDVAGLFPEITPAPTPSPGPEGTNRQPAQRQPGRAAADVFTSTSATPGTGAHRPSGRLPAGDDPAVRAQADKQTTAGSYR